jgi:hypothetical protein
MLKKVKKQIWPIQGLTKVKMLLELKPMQILGASIASHQAIFHQIVTGAETWSSNKLMMIA